MARANRAVRGWGVHDSRICLDNLAPNDGEPENSSYTQKGGRPGSPVAVDALGTYLPHVHQAQEEDLTVVALRAGIPGTDTGAGIGYRVVGEADGDTRGWDEPNLVTGYAPIAWTTTENWTNADAVTCPGSQIVVVVGSDATLTLGPTVWRRNPDGGNWSVGQVIDSDLPATSYTSCCALLRETGRVIVFTRKVGVLAFEADARIHYSDDDGDTWELYAEPEHLNFAITAITRFRMIEDRHGNLLLFATDDSTGDYWQFVSTDGGATWATHDEGSAWGTEQSLALTAAGQILVALIDFGTDTAAWIVLDDAFDPVGGKTPTSINDPEPTSQVACAADADGVLYVAITPEASDLVRMARSVDGGASFELYERDVLGTGGSVANPTDHRHQIRALAPSGGQLVAVLTANHTGGPTTDGSLISLLLGGWSNVEAPTGSIGSTASRRITRIGWADSDDQDLNGIFLPTEILEDQGWVPTGNTETLADGYHRFAAAAATSFATLTFTGHSTTPAAVLFEAQVIDGGDVANDDLCLLYVRRDGSDESRLRIRLSETGFRVRDDDTTSPSNLGTVTMDMTAGITQFLILSGHKITKGRYTTVLYRPLGATLWTQVAQAELESTATATTTDQIRVGITSSATGDLRVGVVAWSDVGSLARWLAGLEDVSNYTTRLRWGKALGTRPYPLGDQIDADGRMAFLSGSGGSARLQERWQIATEWDHGLRELDPCASPSTSGWWESLDTSEQILTWDLLTDTRLGSSWLWTAVFVGANFHQALIEASTDADPTTWVQLGGYNGFTDSGVALAGVPFVRTGDLIRPGPGAAGDRFYALGDAAGGQIILDPPGSPKPRTITWNSAGWIRDSGLQAEFRIEGLDGTEPTSGVMYVVANGGVVVMHPEDDPPVAYRRYRLRIPEQDTPSGTFKLRKFSLGGGVVPGRHWSHGWSIRHVPITREETDDEGTSHVDPRGADHRRSVLREITLSFQDGYDERRVRDGTADYLSAAADTPALAADQDVHGQLAGLLRETRGGSLQSVWLAEVPAETTTITDPSMWCWGRLRGTVQANVVQGTEGQDLVTRVESLVHTEV